MKAIKSFFGKKPTFSLKDTESELFVEFTHWLRHVHPNWNGAELKDLVLNMCQCEFGGYFDSVSKLKDKEVLAFMNNHVWH